MSDEPGAGPLRATGRSTRSLPSAARLAAADRLAPPGGEPAMHAIADAAVAALGVAGGLDRPPRPRHRPARVPGGRRARRAAASSG